LQELVERFEFQGSVLSGDEAIRRQYSGRLRRASRNLRTAGVGGNMSYNGTVH
jgi:hypothetical protein